METAGELIVVDRVATTPTVQAPFARPSSFTVRDREILKRVEGNVDSLADSSIGFTASVKRIEDAVSSLGDSTLELATSSKTIAMHIYGVGEHIEQLDPIFVHLVEGQAKHFALINQIITNIESLDKKADSVQAALDSLVLQVEMLTNKNTSDTSESILTLRKDIQELGGAIDSAFTKAYHTTLQGSSKDEGFGSELEDEENPLGQVILPQGHGNFEEGAFGTVRGAGGERFEKGMVRAGRGGGNGGGWCAIM